MLARYFAMLRYCSAARRDLFDRASRQDQRRGPVPRAAAGARSCCVRTSDWDCGCRVEVSRVVSAGAAGACNGAPARRMARGAGGTARRVGDGHGAEPRD
jgi:hypothetical protein